MFSLAIRDQNRLMCSQSTLPLRLALIEMYNSVLIFCWAAHQTKRRIKQPTVINVRRCSHLALDLPPASLTFYKVFSSTESWTFIAQYGDAKNARSLIFLIHVWKLFFGFPKVLEKVLVCLWQVISPHTQNYQQVWKKYFINHFLANGWS